MLTRLRFKNWRSLRDVTIEDLTPITVFVGANSSGKTNIVDGLRFRRDSILKGLVSVVLEQGYKRIKTDAQRHDERVELELVFQTPEMTSEPVTETTILEFDKRDLPFRFTYRLSEGDKVLRDDPLQEVPMRDLISKGYPIGNVDNYERGNRLANYLSNLIQKRWQILGDSFMPPLKLSDREGGNPYVIEPDARNLLFILSFMHQSYPDVYNGLQDDLHWILNHVSNLDVWNSREEGGLELRIVESERRTAPTVSAGTARLIAILTAFYALDMPQESSYSTEPRILSRDMPGLVVIEEPDTALNPGVLRNFVEQLRYFTTGEHPRQVILTTHNPVFLDYFEPEEVRVVTRDEKGYTSVQPIPDSIKENWLDEYGLGEVWRTNSFGGLP
jgi:predicted ATPase